MALTDEELIQIEAMLAATDADSRAFADLRRRFPEITVTRCDPSDVDGEIPYRVYRRFELYLVDGRDHCWRLCLNPDIATGIVVVPRKDEEKVVA